MFFGNIMGGLGNQLFQIFAVISLALKYETQFIFSDRRQLSKIRNAYWDTFLRRLLPFLRHESFIKNNITKILNENKFSYEEYDLSQDRHENIFFYGYFQSYKYFESHYKTIYDLINIDRFKSEIISKYNLSDLFQNNIVISMHFRLGDYKNIQDCHPLLKNIYYLNCLKYLFNEISFDKPIKILYFCQNDPDDLRNVNNMIQELKSKFNYIQELDFINYNLEEDWEEMILMSLCHHNVIANSTFSWWGAYLNGKENKKILYPNVWFGEKLAHNDVSDLFPNDWIEIEANSTSL